MDLCFRWIPGEILSEIFSYLPRTDIKATRQVCKSFCGYSSRYLLDEIIVGSQTETLKRADEISTHPIFCNYITTVKYATCSLRRDYTTLDDYYEDLVERTRYPKATIPTKLQCVRYWQSYQELYKDQERVQLEGNDKRSIQNSLCRLPNIKHLELSCNAWESSAHPLRSVWDAGDEVIITPSSDPVGGPWQLTHGFEVMAFAFRVNGIRPESLMQTGVKYNSDILRTPLVQRARLIGTNWPVSAC